MCDRYTEYIDNQGNLKRRYYNDLGIIDVDQKCSQETIRKLEELQKKVVANWNARTEREKDSDIPFVKTKEVTVSS